MLISCAESSILVGCACNVLIGWSDQILKRIQQDRKPESDSGVRLLFYNNTLKTANQRTERTVSILPRAGPSVI
jgi:hypothetical protein